MTPRIESASAALRTTLLNGTQQIQRPVVARHAEQAPGPQRLDQVLKSYQNQQTPTYAAVRRFSPSTPDIATTPQPVRSEAQESTHPLARHFSRPGELPESSRTKPDPAGSTQPPEGPTFTPADLESILAAFGSTDGQDRFDANWDFDNDGAITIQDLNYVLGNMTEKTE